MYASVVAADLWRYHDFALPVGLKGLSVRLGLEVVEFPFRGRVKEVVVGRTIGVQPSLPRPWFRWYVAHGIGHRLLHAGTNLYLSSWQWASHAKAERQAANSSAWLVGGPDGWRWSAAELGIPLQKLSLVHSTTELGAQAARLAENGQCGTGGSPTSTWGNSCCRGGA